MLTVLGFSMIICFMYLIMTKRLTALIALILVPIAFALIAGQYQGLGVMMINGVKTIAPTGVLLTFSILYFGVMIDAGLFDGLVRAILRLVKGDPLRVLVGTTVLAMLVSLDGDSSTTYMIICAAFLPLYQRLGMNVLGMACVTNVANGIMNIAPWGGPTARAAAALHVDAMDIFIPMIPAMVISSGCLLLTAVVLGRRERSRLGVIHLDDARTDDLPNGLGSAHAGENTRRPKMFWPNLILTAVLITSLTLGVMPIQILFMIGFAIAIMLNYPRIEDQKTRIAAHAANVLAVTAVIFAAGIFTGILSGTGMVDSMAASLLHAIPPSAGPLLAVFTAVASLPFTFFMSNDAFYFGILPVIARTAAQYGITPLEIARASVVGQPVHLLSPLVAALYLLVALAKIDLGDHQRFTLKWAILASFGLLAGGLIFGAFPLYQTR